MSVKADVFLSDHGVEAGLEVGVCVRHVGHGRDPHNLCWDICFNHHTVTRALPGPMALEWGTYFPLISSVHLGFSNGLAAQCSSFCNISLAMILHL